MADLRVENRKTTEEFVAQLTSANVKLPLHLCEEDVGTILDDDGVDVFTVDTTGERPDIEVGLIAMFIVLAVNTCGGFQGEVRTDG